MAKRKSKHDDFIMMCEKNKKLYTLAATSTPSCNLYDVIDGNFVISEKSTSHKKSSSRRIAKPDTVFIAYRFRGYPTEEQESLLKQNIGAARFMWNRMLSDYNLMWKELGFTIPMTPADYKDVSGMEWLRDMDSSNLANVQLHLEKARNDYFSGDKGKPRFKKKNVCTDSYTTNRTNNNIRMEIQYIQSYNPAFKKRSINKYTPEGRMEIYQNRKVDFINVLTMMKVASNSETVEYADNRISKYSAQNGKCAITGIILELDDIHCHHIIPKEFGGNDKFENLVIVHKDIHILIHATDINTINNYIQKLNLNKKQIDKVNKYRKLANNSII